MLLSLNLAPELRESVGAAESCVFGSGVWYRQGGGRLTQAVPLPDAKDAEAKFCVPEQVELIIINPHAPCGGGLADLLGQGVFDSLRTLVTDSSTTSLGVPSLAAWIPAERQ